MDEKYTGEQIAKQRKLKGLTQEELAETCQLNVRTVQRIEAGETDPRLYTLRCIADTLGVSIESLMPPARSKSERGTLAVLHISTLAYFILPFCGHIIGPLVIWLLKRDTFDQVNRHGKNILNAQISYSIYTILIIIGIIAYAFQNNVFYSTPLPVKLLVTISIAVMVFVVILPLFMAWRAWSGKAFLKYPLSIPFFRV